MGWQTDEEDHLQIILSGSANAMKPALSASSRLRPAVTQPRPAGYRESREHDYLNDALTFWKLPENWREALKNINYESARAAEHYLFERYLSDEDRRPPSALNIYYPIKQFVPRYLRHRFNAIFIRARLRNRFPAWPCETALLEYWKEWLRQALMEIGVSEAHHLAFWPNASACCIVLTHDVESRAGFDRMERMADLEESLGFRSCWNLPLGQYRIDWNRVERLRARGFEFGAHGLCHDGKLFRTRQDFDRLSAIIERIAQEHDLIGFRAPSTLRSLEWIATMKFSYDSSVADSDPFEPQAGGCCSVFPFHLGGLVELPYTLPQDHTMIHLLNRNPLVVWLSKAMWIASVGGMILILTHPDYIGSGRYLETYADLLRRLSNFESKWCALPSEVAAWWRRRSDAALYLQGRNFRIEGPDTTGIVTAPLRISLPSATAGA